MSKIPNYPFNQAIPVQHPSVTLLGWEFELQLGGKHFSGLAPKLEFIVMLMWELLRLNVVVIIIPETNNCHLCICGSHGANTASPDKTNRPHRLILLSHSFLIEDYSLFFTLIYYVLTIVLPLVLLCCIVLGILLSAVLCCSPLCV